MKSTKVAVAFCVVLLAALRNELVKSEIHQAEREEMASNFVQQVESSVNADNAYSAAVSNPCVYEGPYYSIDIQKFAPEFEGVNISDPNNEHFIYFVSLCSPIACSFTQKNSQPPSNVTAAACQYGKSGLFINLGRSASSEFHVVNLTYFYITFGDGDPVTQKPGGQRQTRFQFKVMEDPVHQSTIEFSGDKRSNDDPPIHTYVFTIYLRFPERNSVLIKKKRP